MSSPVTGFRVRVRKRGVIVTVTVSVAMLPALSVTVSSNVRGVFWVTGGAVNLGVAVSAFIRVMLEPAGALHW